MRLSGLLQSVLIGGHHAQKAMLLDTSVQTSDLVKEGPDGWTISPGSQWMESTEIINQDGETSRVWSICKKPTPNGNMIITPLIEPNTAQSVEAELKYWIRDCNSLGMRTGQCSEEIEVYAQQVDSYEQRNFDTYSPAWEKIGTISAADAVDNDQMGTKRLAIPSAKSGLFLGFKDYGSCTSISSVRVYTSSCNEQTRQLATFKESSISTQTTGKCVENAIQDSYFTEPKMECTESGWREIDYKGCVCAAGYEPDEYNQKCIACQPGTYKRLSGNEQCAVCPVNSDSGVAHTGCVCAPAHYRPFKNRADEECIAIPGPASDIEYTTTETSAHLYWKRPVNYPRRDIYYRLECEQCVNNQCTLCDQQIVFSQGPDDIFEGHKGINELEINNLEPNTLYNLKLFTLNRISAQAREDGKEAKYQRISLRTTVDTHQVTPEVVGSVKVDLRNDEARVTWGSVQTDKYEMVITSDLDAEPERKVLTVSDEHTLTDLAPGQTYTIRVRAVLDGVNGPWSIEEVFKTAPVTSGPSVEPILDEINRTNWVAIIVFGIVLFLALLGVIAFFIVRNVGRKWSKQSNGAYGHQSMDGTMDAHFDLIPQIVRKSPTQIDGLSISSDHESLPAHADMTRGYYHERPVLLQYGYLTEEQFQMVTQLEHQNVLKCLGFAPSRQQLVFEYAEHGTLPALMGYHRLDIVTVTRMLRDIASAISFLHANSYIHRQLTTYNVFVSGASYTPKVAKYLTSSDLRPDLRRSAPEVWEGAPFTIFTDVWSFGTLMWEVMAAYTGQEGQTEPYRGFDETEIVEQMKQGRHLPRPQDCPDAIYALIQACWAVRPAQRPTMGQLYLELENILNQMDAGAVAV